MAIIENQLYCYMTGLCLLEQLEDPAVLDGLMSALKVDGKPAHLRRLTSREKIDAIGRQAEHLQNTPSSLWHGVDMPEIVAATIFRMGQRTKSTMRLYGAAKCEADLAAPVVTWLREEKRVDVYLEVPMGGNQVDVMGHRHGARRGRDFVVAVELKNTLKESKRGLDQLATFSAYATETYLACTPYMAAEYLWKHSEAKAVRHWDGDVLGRKLRLVGAGLVLVQDQRVYEVMRPKSRALDERKLRELLPLLEEKGPLAP
jgi:hypothetical protein